MNSTLPLISVIIPTYNRRQKLERALKSVLHQTLKDIEIIVVDNASQDQTCRFIVNVRDERIRYIRNDTNQGGSVARNKGIMDARAPLIALLDDDDEWFPRKLELQFKKFQEAPSSVGLVYVGTEIFDEQTKKLRKIKWPQYRGEVYERMLQGTILASNSALIKKECFQKAGLFDEKLASCQDWDMWLRIARYYEFDYVNEVLARINLHPEQISKNLSALIPGWTRMVEKHWDEFEQHPDICVAHLEKIGKLHCLNGTWPEGMAWFKAAAGLRRLEVLTIGAWFLLELPWAKFCKTAIFKKYSPLSAGLV